MFEGLKFTGFMIKENVREQTKAKIREFHNKLFAEFDEGIKTNPEKAIRLKAKAESIAQEDLKRIDGAKDIPALFRELLNIKKSWNEFVKNDLNAV